MNNYSKWDNWATTIDEDGEEIDKNKPKFDKPTCVFGKPMTEEEFKNRNDKDNDVQIINANNK